MSGAPLPPLAADWAFFLDVDGTLLEHADTPDAVRVDGAMRRLLSDLQAGAGGALALISGRSVADLDRLFAPLALPAAGQHGAERRDGAGRVLASWQGRAGQQAGGCGDGCGERAHSTEGALRRGGGQCCAGLLRRRGHLPFGRASGDEGFLICALGLRRARGRSCG